MLHLNATAWVPLALFLAASTASAQDDRAQRILDRIEKEIRDSHDRLREEIRAIIRAEIARAGDRTPAPPVRRKVYLGITAGDFTDAERKALGVGGGIKIEDVRGPAAQAGLKGGDILLELGGQPVTEDRIGSILEKFAPGDAVDALVLREKKKETLRIVLAERRE